MPKISRDSTSLFLLAQRHGVLAQRHGVQAQRHCVWVLVWIAITASLGTVGCVDPAQRLVEGIQSESVEKKEKRDSLKDAFQYLPQLIRMDRTVAVQEINYQLNSWSSSVTAPPDWKPSSLLESIPASLRTIDFAQRMTKLEFAEPECEYMMQCQMLKQVSQWVIDKPYRDKLFVKWLEASKSNLPADEWSKLESTLKLFDWTVCNIATEGDPKIAESLVVNPDMPPSDQAPIYRQLPWQTLMFARGEAWQRARVFTQMCFVQGIDAVVLALPSITGATENAALRLWCVGIPIGNEIYLFEPNWGLPIPAANGDGIATLSEAKSDPTVLRRAKLPGRFEYPIESKDLTDVIALVDVEPFAVGRSMHVLERSLTGENRQRLSFDADRFEARLQAIDPKVSVRLWNVPWLSHVYNLSIRTRLDDMSPFAMAYLERFGSYVTDTPMSRARVLHFKGQLETTIDAPGALRMYMDCRIDEETLRELQYDGELQKSFGVVKRPNESMDNYQFRLNIMGNYLRQSKFDIVAFLAMANMDLGKPETASDWLAKRLLPVRGTERWHAHAHYLLGRNLESLGNLAEAIEQYKFDASAQAAGNRIRIRRLESLSNPSAAPEVDQ
ncbi:MAG: tetratricopeptide repeat protein [Planctomycetota bacterium]